ncbi:TVP38/TMEM64 family protein [Parvibaculum sp.]|uniref:TVP38/TMEM64 family protein n=1 Tax=Parvibaculum sp. TaxID=2024848 RepID=UPI00271F8EAD|nr:TVP38/TMEM64 family protein [Parvibaculum sp.]MDO9126356.1 TVP38/TMEM64 family protein [Parvibaculum sp.]MDP1626386.1 TVP38/TMEM64 family protein [Parvibaculum sp.]MDP2151223.1 TVP38/TMEM64 family protein [Parvibaculum sp.]MDP3329123.1 TVP38/TMEM64 family protein [Parvibaculum sp.]
MTEPTPAASRLSLRRLLPLIVLAAGLAAFFALGLHRYLTLDTLRDNRQALAGWVADHWLLAALAYVGAYIAIVAFSLPAALVATLTGGFLFGTVFGGLLTVIGATIGATLLFLAARTALGDMLRAKAGPKLRKLEEGFGENAFSYMLVLRLVPLFPFFLVNLAPAFLGVPLRTYVAATFLGILPGTFVYASLGNGLGAIFEAGRDPDLGLIFQPQVIGPILALALLALVPVVYRRFAGKGRTGAAE